MNHARFLAIAVAMTVSTAALAQEMDNIYMGDKDRYVDPWRKPASPAPQQNAVVPYGSGYVKPLGPGQNRNTAGIGGSATSAPRTPVAARTPGQPLTTGSVTPSRHHGRHAQHAQHMQHRTQ